jgi:hypothetical protein
MRRFLGVGYTPGRVNSQPAQIPKEFARVSPPTGQSACFSRKPGVEKNEN